MLTGAKLSGLDNSTKGEMSHAENVFATVTLFIMIGEERWREN